jgi:hypothetical protein
MKRFQELIRRLGKGSVESEVDEELQFHIDMQSYDYEKLGVAADKSRVMAEKRFGNVERIKDECVRISKRTTVLTWMLNAVFLMFLIVGLFVRLLGTEMHINRVGDVMMMIGGLGILLVYAKQAGAMVVNSKTQRLGLNKTTPVNFDEQGRTPFDRVRED